MRQVLTLSLLAAFGLAAPAAVQDYDIVIANGRVIDPESGLDAVRTVGIRGNTIAAIGDAPLRGATLIDARGLVVAPGFIDLHRHGQDDENYGHAARDGVTSVFELEVGTPDVERWYREREPGRLINYGVAIGHIGVRIAVMGDTGDFLPSGPAGSAVATEPQIAEMARRIDEGLRQGAVAVGFGTAYTPAASPWEILEMFRVAGRHRATAHIHVRRGVEGVQEALADAVATGTPLHIVHVNSTAGNDIGRMLALITDAQQRGIDVTTEAYPYNRGSTRLESALYDNWERMTDAEIGQITWVETGESLTRESLPRYRQIGGSVIQRPGRMENVQQAINSPITMIASDGSQLRNGRGHPRATGTYSQVLGRYVREAGTLTLIDALRKMTIMPARRLEARVPAMRNKGRLRVGADADIVVFDTQRVIDRSTYQQAGLAPDGIAHVIVNGTPVVSGGRVLDGVAPGRAIRAPVDAPVSAQAASPDVARHVEAARAAAGEDYAGLFKRLCTPEGAIAAAIAPKPAGEKPNPPATRPPGPPARSTWEAPPAKVFDNLYFVGEKEYSAWAVTTPDGIVIIDTIFEYSVDSQIAGGLRAFGLDPATIKYAIVSHGHRDHSGGARYLQDSFKTRVLMSAADWDLLAANTRDPAKPTRDIVVTDGQTLALGGTTLTMYLTPGHTLGTVSTIVPVTDGGRQHVAAYWGGTAFNFGPSKERLDQYAASARRFADIVRKVGADVLISNHTIFDGSKTKLPALATRKAGGPHPYVVGTDSVLRYLKVAEECATAIRLQLP